MACPIPQGSHKKKATGVKHNGLPITTQGATNRVPG